MKRSKPNTEKRRKNGTKVASRKFTNGLAKVGDVYYYRFSHKGRIHQGSTGCSIWVKARTQLLIIKQEVVDLAGKAPGTVILQVPTFSEAINLWYDSRLGKKSQVYLDNAKRMMELHVVPKLGNVRCDILTFDIVEVVLNDYLHGQNLQFKGKKRNLGGYNTLASWISAVLGNLVPTYMVNAPRIKKEKKQKRRKPFIPREQVEVFLSEVDRTNNLHVSVAVRAMLYMGLRESEALDLNWANIDWVEKTYCPAGWVGGEGETKGKEDGRLDFPPDMEVWLCKVQAAVLAEKPMATFRDGLVIPAEDGKAHRKQFTKKAIMRGGDKIGVRLTPHRMRGSFATLLGQRTRNAFLVKDMLRHKDIRTSEGYVDLGREDHKKASQDLWGTA